MGSRRGREGMGSSRGEGSIRLSARGFEGTGVGVGVRVEEEE